MVVRGSLAQYQTVWRDEPMETLGEKLALPQPKLVVKLRSPQGRLTRKTFQLQGLRSARRRLYGIRRRTGEVVQQLPRDSVLKLRDDEAYAAGAVHDARY